MNVIHPEDRKKWSRQKDERIKLSSIRQWVAEHAQPEVIIEIGVRCGYSALDFLIACPKATYYGFDNNAGEHGGADDLRYHKWAKKLLSGYNATIYPDVDTQSIDELPVKGDFAHIDGDHSYEGCMHDIKLARKAGAKWILVDDFDYQKNVKRAVQDSIKDTDYCEYFDGYHGQVLIRGG